MESNDAVRVHDLLWISKDTELLSLGQPAWVREALTQSSVVVVRRADAPSGFIPVGIRGSSREQRHAAFLRKDDVLACRTPESLAAEQVWHEASAALPLPLLRALKMVGEFSRGNHLVWGPIGSVGYQLATGTPVTGATSDLDMLVRCDASLSRACLRALHTIHTGLVRVDVILEGPVGAVALEEYLQDRPALIKTVRGPRIEAFTW
jgi:phosphoribosyl-dephospho-CoA transferase